MNTSRRDVLALGAAAMAGACVAGSGAKRFVAARGADRARPQPGQPIRIGIVGMGAPSTPAMGFAHLQRFCALAKAGNENVQVVAISDCAKPYLERGVEFAAREQGLDVKGYRDYRDLLARDDLHGVLVATPEHWHAQISIDAMMKGIDVYCEKPMTYDLEQALALRATVNANPQNVFQCGTQFLQHRKYWKARELIASGAIGKPTFSQTSYCRNSKNGEWLYGIDDKVVPGEMLDWDMWCGPAGKQPFDPAVFFRWRRYKTWSSGIVGDLLVHVTTPLVYALDQGWPTRVTASGGHYVDHAMENFDQVNLTVEFEKGHTMTIAGSTCNETGVETLVRGHEANLYLASNDCVLRPEHIFAEEKEEQTFVSPAMPVQNDQDAHRLHWMQCMRTREKAIGDVDTASKVMVIVDLAHRSMFEGCAWSFDPATMTARRA
ncbi:MAG: Gfo/Idh/MocA family oxidoreductase [Planctomycetes bacterium]|nr:Gfo/Idh/MocA family oxidoreductase [Planctomycetota bacterium]